MTRLSFCLAKLQCLISSSHFQILAFRYLHCWTLKMITYMIRPQFKRMRLFFGLSIVCQFSYFLCIVHKSRKIVWNHSSQLNIEFTENFVRFCLNWRHQSQNHLRRNFGEWLPTYLHKYKQHSSAWKADSSSASKRFLRLLGNLDVHYPLHKSTPPVSTLR